MELLVIDQIFCLYSIKLLLQICWWHCCMNNFKDLQFDSQIVVWMCMALLPQLCFLLSKRSFQNLEKDFGVMINRLTDPSCFILLSLKMSRHTVVYIICLWFTLTNLWMSLVLYVHLNWMSSNWSASMSHDNTACWPLFITKIISSLCFHFWMSEMIQNWFNTVIFLLVN